MKKIRENIRRFDRQGKGAGSAISLSSIGLLCMVLIPWTVYQKGAGAGWIAIGFFAGILLLWLLSSYRLLRFSLQQGEHTIPGYFSRRFAERRPVLRFLFTGVLILLIFLAATMMLYGIMEFGQLIFGNKEYLTAIGIILISTGLYLLLGKTGLRVAERWVSVLILFAVIVLNVAIFRVLGTRGILENIFHSWAAGSVSEYVNVGYMEGRSLSIPEILSLFSLGFLAMANPISLQQLQQTDRAGTIHRSRRWAVIFSLLMLFLSTLTGGMLRASLYPAKVTSAADLYRWLLVEDQGRGFLFHLTGVIFVAAAAIMVLCLFHDCILQMTLLFHENIYPYIFPRRKKKLQDSTVFTIILIVAELLVAILAVESGDWIYRLTGLTFLVVGSGLGPVVILSLNNQRTTGSGCLAGFLGGALTAFLWTFGSWFTKAGIRVTLWELSDVTGLIPGMAVAFLLTILVSGWSRAPSKKVVEAYEEVKFRLVTGTPSKEKERKKRPGKPERRSIWPKNIRKKKE